MVKRAELEKGTPLSTGGEHGSYAAEAICIEFIEVDDLRKVTELLVTF
jgi:hypothetical protein